jgi:hypothetical protein
VKGEYMITPSKGKPVSTTEISKENGRLTDVDEPTPKNRSIISSGCATSDATPDEKSSEKLARALSHLNYYNLYKLKNHNFLLNSNEIVANTSFSLLYKKILEKLYEEIDYNEIKCSQYYQIPIIKSSRYNIIQNYISTFGNIITINLSYSIIQYNESYLIIWTSNNDYITRVAMYIFSDTIRRTQHTFQTFRNHFKEILESETIPKVSFTWHALIDGKMDRFCKHEYLDDDFHIESYPFIDNISHLISSYLDSDAPILLLKGPAGTGKTRFIREILRHLYKKLGRDIIECIYTSSKEIIENGTIFLNLVFGDADVLVLEDVDYHLSPRTDGNTSMYSLLSVSNGIMSNSMKDKKIILSTNLPNINNVDDALKRPGRCFDVIDMKPLTPDQADVVFKKLGKKRVIEQKVYTLADIYNS